MFPRVPKLKKIVYLDHAAATPLDESVKSAMEPFWSGEYGNPSALYKKGREARSALDQARITIASSIGARPEEIIFTAGGTESVNLAIFGSAKFGKTVINRVSKKPHFIASAIEHKCVINSLQVLEGRGYKTSLVPVDDRGFVQIEQLKKMVRPETVFISIMSANNEIGSIQPVSEIGKWLKGLNSERVKQRLPKIILHTDACQAAGSLDLSVDRLGVDLMSVNGSKIYGPKQTGFLYVRNGISLDPIIYGGGQERSLRSGTENVAGFAGLAKAFELSQLIKDRENERLAKIGNYLISEISKLIPGSLLNGPDKVELKDLKRLPNNINFTFKGVDGEALMLYLDSYGIEASASSACTAASAEPSHVLMAIGRSEQDSKNSIRFSLGRSTTKRDIDYLIRVLKPIVSELRKVSTK